MPGDTLHINNKAQQQNTYDAIVIGSGISGGWAAKELAENGLKVLMLERGKNVVHLKDYPTATLAPWEFPHHGEIPIKIREENPVVSRCYAFYEGSQHFFVKDKEHPYVQEKPFDWIRGYQVGGKSLLWARQTQRWSKFDFEGPARDGYATDWPIRYDDIAPWYSHVETFAGISGNFDNLETLPDGEFLPPWEMNCVEKDIQQKINSAYPNRNVIQGRCAHLTKPKQIHIEQGRTQCQARSLCERGCPFGGYFSSNASTIPWALKTGNLTIQPESVVHSIIYDDKKDKAVGVNVVDANTKKSTQYFSKIIFVNAACFNTNLILLNSVSNRFPNGFGNDNGLLGKYIAFHNYRGTVSANYDGPMDKYYYGRRPTQPMMPNFRNVYKQEMDFQRGYMTFYGAGRGRAWGEGTQQIGGDYKDALTEAGDWFVSMMMQGETIPKQTNEVYLSKDKKDDWGIPQLIFNVAYDDNDERLMKDFLTQASEMLDKAGCKNIQQNDSKQAPGLDIHEMGGVRMGKDPKTSMLNAYNQFHNCKNVFVTDGASMTSTSTQNPSLTFMALTARAANHAVSELKKRKYIMPGDTLHINNKAQQQNTYDAIVIGSGISGGWAAKELCENGLKVLMLERGRNFEHIKDYKSASENIWEFPHHGRVTQEELKRHPIIARTWGTYEPIIDYWANDVEAPYVEVKPFKWWRAYQFGGRSILWGRQSYRWSDFDFEGNAKDGWAIDWPIRYKDVEPWYNHVEEFIGVSGSTDGLPQLPDGHFTPPMDLTCVEKDVSARIKEKFNRSMIIGRSANTTIPKEGRTNCQFRNRCWEGCPFGGYFSTQSSTFPAAMKTGNLTMRPWSIVTKILYDKNTKKATGVEVLDAENNQTYQYNSKIVFVNASALNSAWILMNSATDIWPDGLGSSSGELGHNIMDHHYNVGASGTIDGYEDKYYYGRRPNGFYIVRFANLFGDKRDFLRGFGYQGGGSRESWSRSVAELSIGGAYKDELTEPGGWTIGMTGFGELLPYHENKISLDKNKKDKWGLPVLAMDAELRENEFKMRKAMKDEAVAMFEATGVKNIASWDNGHEIGDGIHEMGSARMGNDPKTSVLNKWNQVWDAQNVFVTDGAFMVSSACQNPSLTYMAMTARAANHAVEELKKGNI